MELLPYELIQIQLETFYNLQSIFPLENELILTTPNDLSLLTLLTVSNLHSLTITAIEFNLSLSLDSPQSVPPISIQPLQIELSISLPLYYSPSSSSLLNPPFPIITLRHGPWLSRKSHAALSILLEEEFVKLIAEEDGIESTSLLLLLVDYLKDASLPFLQEYLASLNSTGEGKGGQGGGGEMDYGDLVRVWYWFRSLSTKEKRDDIVNWSRDFDLTGFVLAGKPGIMCLEGREQQIDTFMNEIKSISWADIPSFQKKVSERHRTLLPLPSPPLGSPSLRANLNSHSKTSTKKMTLEALAISQNRIFTSMTEITDGIEKGGARGNKGDMGQVREFLMTKGLGEIFGIVVSGATSLRHQLASFLLSTTLPRSNTTMSDQQFNILPHPAKDNINPEATLGLGSSPNLAHLPKEPMGSNAVKEGKPIHIPSPEIVNKLEAPMSREELKARGAELNQK